MTFSQLIVFIIIGAVMLVGYLAYITKTLGNKKVKSSDTLDLERIEKAKELEKLQATEPKKISEQLSKSGLYKKAMERRQELLNVSPKIQMKEEPTEVNNVLGIPDVSDDDIPPTPSINLPPKTETLPPPTPSPVLQSPEISFEENDINEQVTNIEEYDKEEVEDRVEELSRSIGEELVPFHRKNNYEKYPEESRKIVEILKGLLSEMADDSLKVY